MKELLNRIDSRELAEWQILYEQEPFGYDQRIDMQQASAAYVLACIHSRKNRRPRIVDFMAVRPRPKRQTAEQIKAIIGSIVGRVSGKK